MNKIIYPNLAAELARLGITYISLAKSLGISRAALYKKMSGAINFTLKDITAIQEILKTANSDGDYTLDYLFYRADAN